MRGGLLEVEEDSKFYVVAAVAGDELRHVPVVLSLGLSRVAPVWLQGLAIVPAVLVNYFLNSYWTFRDAGRE